MVDELIFGVYFVKESSKLVWIYEVSWKSMPFWFMVLIKFGVSLFLRNFDLCDTLRTAIHWDFNTRIFLDEVPCESNYIKYLKDDEVSQFSFDNCVEAMWAILYWTSVELRSVSWVWGLNIDHYYELGYDFS